MISITISIMISTMNIDEMRIYVEKEILKQGSASAKALAPLFKSILDALSENPDGLVETPAILISEEPAQTETNSTMYNVNNEQNEIDEVIDIVNREHKRAKISVRDNNLTILFPFVEYAVDSVTAISPAHDGYYYLHLNIDGGSYMMHYCFTNAVAPVTEGEISVYNKLFGAEYDRATNRFKVLVGSTVYNLTPADMILADQEYDKVANTVNYTAMWSNSKAKYIKCHDWFSGFSSDIDLHSAFFGCAEAEAIDLNVNEELVVANMTNAFAGCVKLQEITGIISLPDTGYSVFGAFSRCAKLHSVKIKNLSLDIDFSQSEQLSAESVGYIVDNAKSGAAFVVKLHPTVLEKYNGSSDWADVRSKVNTNGKIKIQ